MSDGRKQLQSIHGSSRMDGFKVAGIFAKVEFVGYVSNMCTVRLQLDLELY